MNNPLSAIRAVISRLGITECEAMNRLQDFGHVSDEAVNLTDCAPSDLQNALNATD